VRQHILLRQFCGMGRLSLYLSVSLNPVRPRLVRRAEEWPWSSVWAHLAGRDDCMVSVRPVLDRRPTFRDLLLEDYEEKFSSLREAKGARCARGDS
jgi:putative transposase